VDRTHEIQSYKLGISDVFLNPYDMAKQDFKIKIKGSY